MTKSNRTKTRKKFLEEREKRNYEYACERCHGYQAMHYGEKKLCCQCWIETGGIPVDGHIIDSELTQGDFDNKLTLAGEKCYVPLCNGHFIYAGKNRPDKTFVKFYKCDRCSIIAFVDNGVRDKLPVN